MAVLKFANVADADNVVNKTVEPALTLNGTFRGVVDVAAPRVRINDVRAARFNYCECPELSRFYFVDSVEYTRAGVVELQLRVDVLKTYADAVTAAVAAALDPETVDYDTPFTDAGTLVMVASLGGTGN